MTTPVAAGPSSAGNLSSGQAALVAAVGCYVMWGFMPLLFMAQAAHGFDAVEILAHRALWALPIAGLLVFAAKQGPQLKAVLTAPKTLAWLALSTALICTNWFVYVWATTHQATLEASLGYYLNPLLNVLVGALLFRERLTRIALVAVGLAAVGVALQAVAIGRLPWIALVLAFSFCAYGVVRKRVKADAQTGLFVECAFLVLPGLAYVAWLQQSGGGHAVDGTVPALLALANGPATVIPLVLFAWAARRMPLSTLGFVQFLAPTLQFGIGVAAGEPLTPLRIASFVSIWAGAGVFAWGALKRKRAAVA